MSHFPEGLKVGPLVYRLSSANYQTGIGGKTVSVRYETDDFTTFGQVIATSSHIEIEAVCGSTESAEVQIIAEIERLETAS